MLMTATSTTSEVKLFFCGYITIRSLTVPPSPISVIISAPENKAPLSKEGGGAYGREREHRGRVPRQRTQISIMSQIWQSRSLCQLSHRRAAHRVTNTGEFIGKGKPVGKNPNCSSTPRHPKSRCRKFIGLQRICCTARTHKLKDLPFYSTWNCLVSTLNWKQKMQLWAVEGGGVCSQFEKKKKTGVRTPIETRHEQRRGDLPTGGCKHAAFSPQTQRLKWRLLS